MVYAQQVQSVLRKIGVEVGAKNITFPHHIRNHDMIKIEVFQLEFEWFSKRFTFIEIDTDWIDGFRFAIYFMGVGLVIKLKKHNV